MATETQTPPALSPRLASFATRLAPAAIPDAVLDHARLCILDSIGIALAAHAYPFGRRALAAAQRLGGAGAGTVIGLADGLPLRDAALANGTLIHSLDFDDTHVASVVHCSASAWPVAFNLGQARGVSGAAALAAYVLAVEIDARLGEVAAGGLQKRGFHPTGIVGAFGAAAAAARLEGLDEARTAHALGIVLSFASGSMAFVADGAWTKRLHPGWAAVAGITAAAFAAADYVGPGAPLEGRFGLYDTLLGADPARELAALGADLGDDWRTLGVAFKPYPACHFNHAFAECALALREAGLQAADVARITALIHPDQVPVVCEPLPAKQAPANAYEAQFSVPWIVAASLRHGRFTLAELDDAALADADTRALAACVDYAEDPDSRYPQYYSGGLVVTTRDGRTLDHHVAINRGTRTRPMSTQEIRDKFHANAARSITRDAAERIAECVLGLAEAPNLDALAAALAVPARAAAGER